MDEVLNIISPKKSKKHQQQYPCDLLYNEDLENKITAVLGNEKIIDKIYKCNVCKMSFSCISALNKHKTELHIEDEGIYIYCFCFCCSMASCRFYFNFLMISIISFFNLEIYP